MKMKIYLLALIALCLPVSMQAEMLKGPKVIVQGNLVNIGEMVSTIPIDLQSTPDGVTTINNTQSGDIIAAGMNISDGTLMDNSGTLTVNHAPSYIENITISKTQACNVAGVYPMSATIVPKAAKNTPVVWTSSNPAVATIDASTGLLTVTSDGQTDITCKSTDALNATSNTCKVTVAIKIPVVQIDVLNKTPELKAVGDSTTCVVEVIPATANHGVIWSSSKPNVATVDATTGVITAVAPGKTTITATSTSKQRVTGMTEVTVNLPATGTVISAATDNLTAVGAQTTYKAKVYPDGVNQAVTWSSSNTSVATVNESTGVVTAVKYGTAIITATSKLTPTVAGTKEVKVNIAATRVGVFYNQTTDGMLGVGDHQTVNTVTVSPTAANQAVTWSSSNTGVATVDAITGEITAVASGIAVITATSTATPTVTGTETVRVCGAQVLGGSYTYNVGKFGSAGCWMTENLRETNGLTENKNPKKDVTLRYYTKPNNGGKDYKTDMGLLYTWAAATGQTASVANDRNATFQGICPTGWHVPSINEWDRLAMVISADSSGKYSTLLKEGKPEEKMLLKETFRPVDAFFYMSTKGKSKPSSENGFALRMVGYVTGKTVVGWGVIGFLWSSHSPEPAKASGIGETIEKTRELFSVQWSKATFGSVRCKLD